MTEPLPHLVLLARCRALLGQALDRRTQDWPIPCTLALPPACTRDVLAHPEDRSSSAPRRDRLARLAHAFGGGRGGRSRDNT